MKCPHCLVSFHPEPRNYDLEKDKDYWWSMTRQQCPSCNRFVFYLNQHNQMGSAINMLLVYPKNISRTSLSPEIPEIYSTDYKEACLVLTDSPKASAALSRRCLQNILREKAGVKKQDLGKEIDEILAAKQLPSHLAEGIDAVRHIGNFAAHPIKSTSSGEIVDVEPGEAEWTLDLLEGLFDFYFIQPAILQSKKEALNKKLADAGKPAMK